MAIIGLAITLFASCGSDSDSNNPTTKSPLNNGTNVRNLVLVISDIHLGADANYEEIRTNRAALANFLEQVKASPNVKELVIAGDFFDEWFVPDTLDTYQGGDQAGFVDRIAATNKTVFDALRSIINDGKILVTYVPGNHDLTISEANVSRVLSGINQCRDAALLGLGSYSPADLPEVVIEHGHRYNMFCAPDPFSNQSIAPGTITPPGYFFTRIGATHVAQKCEKNIDEITKLTIDGSASVSQKNLYNYWTMWAWSLNFLPVNRHFDEKKIFATVDGFNGHFSINDLLPYQETPGGEIKVNLYDGIQDNWAQRCSRNNVSVPIPTEYALLNAATSIGTDTMAYWQYFNNSNSKKRIVVFGHTHQALIKNYTIAGKKCIYANSGTWIDDNHELTSMNFVVITPQGADASSKTYVRLYNFQNEIMTQMNEDSVRF